VRSDGEIVDGHLRIKAARKLGIDKIPVILCDEWTPAQVKAFRLLVNRSVTWAAWDEELLALELQEIQDADFDVSLTGFDPGEIDDLLALDDEEKPTPRRRCLQRPCPNWATCGSWDRTAFSAAIPPTRKPLRGYWASASRDSGSLILRMESSWTASGVIAPA
jgi:hypothetical protein